MLDLSAKRRSNAMPQYISLIRYTEKGVESLKDSPKRL